jgi:hypothetical protein
MSNPNRVIASLLMNNKITVKNTTAIIVHKTLNAPAIVKHNDNYHGLNEEVINSSHFLNYNGLAQAKVLNKEEYNPFKHQMGKD